ncbi:MAG: hypothetical protein WC101_04780 [Candidatus Gracilibacteria bacterium]
MKNKYSISKILGIALIITTLTSQVALGAVTFPPVKDFSQTDLHYPTNPTTGVNETRGYHDHTYYNNTVENNSKIYRSLIREFRVYLANDLISNTDLAKIICAGTKGSVLPDAKKFESCNTYYATASTENDPNYYGTKVSIEENNTALASKEEKEYDASAPSKAEYPKMIRWQFAMDYADGTPEKANHYQAILAASETLDTIACKIANNKPTSNTQAQINMYAKICANKTSDYQNRSFFAADANHHIVNLLSKDLTPLANWSATSVSKILIADQYIAIPKNTTNWDPFYAKDSIWTPIIDRTTPTGKKIAWKWVNIGKDVLTWSPTKTPPSSGFCQSLTVTNSSLDANTPITFTVNPKTQGTGDINDLQFTWTASSGTFDTAFPTKNKTVKYLGGPDKTTITVTTKDSYNTYAGCSATFTLKTKDTPPCIPGTPGCGPCVPGTPGCPPGGGGPGPGGGSGIPPIDCTKFKGTPEQCPYNYHIEKRVEGKKSLNISRTGTGFKVLKYQILYTPVIKNNLTAYTEIQDELWGTNAKITGSEGGYVVLNTDNLQAHKIRVTEIGNSAATTKDIAPCSGNQPSSWIGPCYKGNIKVQKKISIYGATKPIMITYFGNVYSKFDCKKASPKNGCGESFSNKAEYWEYGGVAKIGNSPQGLGAAIYGWDKAVVLAICPYVLTRAGGDVLFESGLKIPLVDINKCSNLKSSDDVIITPKDVEKDLNKTGGDANGFDATHKICERSNEDTIDPKQPVDYRNPVKNVSSLLCEFQLPIGEKDKFQKTIVQNSVEDSKLRVARWSEWTGTPKFTNIPAGRDVFLVKGKNISIGSAGITMDNSSFVIGGGKVRPVTFIVEDGDIYIDGNINTASDNTIFSNQGTIALIALNGNIIINKNVDTISAVLYAQKGGRGDIKSGNITGEDSEKMLMITGSVYGEINGIVGARNPAGAILSLGKDESAFTVRYDERIFFSTPPVLQDLVDISQKEVVR